MRTIEQNTPRALLAIERTTTHYVKMTTNMTTVRRSTVLKVKIAMAILIVPLAIAAILVTHYYGMTAGFLVGLLWCLVVAAAKPRDQ
ncbi:MAG: hypothetical protein ACOCS7_02520 [Halolamina sp.]